jgi:hypothetical protein
MNLATPKAGAELELLFNKPGSYSLFEKEGILKRRSNVISAFPFDKSSLISIFQNFF